MFAAGTQEESVLSQEAGRDGSGAQLGLPSSEFRLQPMNWLAHLSSGFSHLSEPHCRNSYTHGQTRVLCDKEPKDQYPSPWGTHACK